MAKFSRNSTAYADDGSVVAANVPRMSSKGLLIEESTTNLLPSTAQNAVVNSTTLKPVAFAITTGLVQGGTYTLHGYKRIFDDDVSVNPRVTLLLTYSDSTYDQVTAVTTKNGEWQYFQISKTANSAKTLTKVYGWICDFSPLTGLMHQECKLCQLEQKSYATSYTDGTRAAESLTIPATALNASEGTIEFDYIPVNQPNSTKISQQTSPKILQIGTYNTANSLTLWDFMNLTRIYGKGNVSSGGWTINTYKPFPFTLGQKYHMALRWKTANTFDVLINGIPIVQNAVSSVPFTGMGNIILGDTVSSGGVNAIYSNFRISNKWRTDAELTNTGALSVDEFTTYFLPMNGNLGAQTAPRVIAANGEGQTEQSRTGAGYRSMVTQDEVATLLKRKAEFHPLIVASGEGLTEQSRIGSGYRTAVVQSSADVKVIEPGIEISTEVLERKGVTTVIERLSRTEVIGVPYAGDTITLKAEFYTKGGLLADPENITLKLYDTLNKQIGTTVNIGSQHRISAGVYEYDYTVPSGYSNIFYEFAATQESTPQLIPGRISCKRRVDV